MFLLSLWRRGLVVDTWLWDQEVPGSSFGCARSTLSHSERLFTCISSPHSCVKRAPDYRQYPRVSVICNDSSSVMLRRELRKVQLLEWPAGDPM